MKGPKVHITFYFSFYVLFFFLLNSLADESTILKEGDIFPNILLMNTLSSEDIQYLGLSTQKTYTLSDIKADFILVEVFSIYCPACQNHTEEFNHLCALIQENDTLRGNVKMIGIGAGNNRKEVEFFREYYNVFFPLIPDEDFTIHKLFKETRTPLLIIINKKSTPYKTQAILDFTKDPELLIEDIKSALR